MAKLTLFDLSSGSFTVDLLNANFALIEAALENTLSLDGTTPNSMDAPLDMNSNRILNLPTAATNSEPVTLGQLTALSTLVLYTPENHVHAWTDITGKPSTFTPTAHTHTESEIIGLSSDLIGLTAGLAVLESRPRAYVQAAQPTADKINDLWFY